MEKNTWIVGGMVVVLVASALLTDETATTPRTIQHDPPHSHDRAAVVLQLGSTATVTGTSSPASSPWTPHS